MARSSSCARLSVLSIHLQASRFCPAIRTTTLHARCGMRASTSGRVCGSTNDVVRAVQFARINNLLVAVKGGRHNVAGRARCDDGLVIDLSLMKQASVDAPSRTATVEAGALREDVDRETHPHGLAVPAGVMSKTGVAGLALGGGVGWLARKYGLTCDSLLSCDVVSAQGEVLQVH